MVAPLMSKIVNDVLPTDQLSNSENAVILLSAAAGLGARSGGGQASATPITTNLARFTTVGSAGDSAVLPPAIPGLQIQVKNGHASNSMNVFPASQSQGGATGGDAMNTAAAQNAAFAVAATKTCTFSCYVTGVWDTQLTA